MSDESTDDDVTDTENLVYGLELVAQIVSLVMSPKTASLIDAIGRAAPDMINRKIDQSM